MPEPTGPRKKFYVTVKYGFNPQKVAEQIKRVKPGKITVLSITEIPETKTISGVVIIKCSPEWVQEIKRRRIRGIKDIEEPRPRKPKPKDGGIKGPR